LIVSEEEVMTTNDDEDAHDSKLLLNENSKHSSMTESDEEWDLLSVSNEVVVDMQQQLTDKANNHTDIIAELEEKVASLRKELRRLQQNNRRWKERYLEYAGVGNRMVHGEGSNLVECASKAVEELMLSEDRYMHVSGWHSEKACKQYQKAIGLQIWANESTFYQNLHSLLIAHVKQYLRQTVFHPAKILMQMDLAGGTLSMEGLEVLRMCETDGDKYIRNTIICCSADIKLCCGKVDSLAKCIVPYEHGHLDDANGGGEYIQWDARHMMAAMIKAYQLHEVAKERPVEVHVVIDGAQLSKNWNHLTAGAKQGDNAALCPRKKHLIYGNADTTTIQSHDHCFPYIMAMCHETKKSIEWMRPQLKHLEAMGKEGVKWWGDYKHLQIVHNLDLSLMWKYRE